MKNLNLLNDREVDDKWIVQTRFPAEYHMLLYEHVTVLSIRLEMACHIDDSNYNSIRILTQSVQELRINT